MNKALTLALFLLYISTQSSYARTEPNSQPVCRDEIQIAQESGRIVVDFEFHPMMTLKTDPIKCVDGGRRSAYWYANECSLKMSNCGAYVLFKEKTGKLTVCYYDTNSEDDLEDAPDTWDESYMPNANLWACLGTYLSQFPIRDP